MAVLLNILLAGCVVTLAVAATVDKHVFETEDAVVVEAAGLEDVARDRRQVAFQRAATVIPPGWPGLPAGVTNKCDTADGRSGNCVTRSVCIWTRNLPTGDRSMERSLGSCMADRGRDAAGRGLPQVRGVCCPGLFASESATEAPSTTSAPSSTFWWQTSAATAAAQKVTTPRPTTTTTTKATPTTTKWWQSTKKPDGTDKWWLTSSIAASNTKRPTVPTIHAEIPDFITHPWMTTSTATPPQQITGWWQTTEDPSAKPSTTKPTSTAQPTPSTTAWWQSTTTEASVPSPNRNPSEKEMEGSGGSAEEVVDFSACGTRNLDTDRIVNGVEANKGEFPWMAAMFKRGRQFCGGSLIDETHILTAAHCVAHMTPYDVRQMKVRLGDHDVSTSGEADHTDYKVARVVRHKGFSEQTLHTDIALLTLTEKVKYRDNIRPICLAKTDDRYTGESVTVAGWGTLSEAGRQPSKLQKVSLRVWKNSVCASSYGRSAPGGIIKSMLCAAQEGKDACSGDSGGPLMKIGPAVTQVGVVSWGIGCAKPQYPGVYTRVNDLLPWIIRNRDAY